MDLRNELGALVPALAASRLLIVAGKGGVGKTTVTAALAVASARAGRRVLAVELETDGALGLLLGAHGPLGYETTTVLDAGEGRVDARLVVPGDALREYLEDRGLRRLTSRLVRTGLVDLVATAAPGIDDILVLGKVKQLARSGEYDLIVLDAPAAGHAITFLRSPLGLADAVTGGPIAGQASDVLEMLRDAELCQVLLVTLAEETPVNEVIDTAYALEDEVGIKLGPLVVNGLYPHLELAARPPARSLGDGDQRALDEAATFRRARQAQQDEQVERLSTHLPLPQLHLPMRFVAGLGPDDVDVLAACLHAHVAGALTAEALTAEVLTDGVDS